MNQKLATSALSLVLATSALMSPATAQARKSGFPLWCPLVESNCSTVEMAIYTTFSPILLPAGTTAQIIFMSLDKKLAVAAAAMEDVAVYYGTGRLSGVLPVILPNVKENLARERAVSSEQITDLEAVERIAEVASQVF